MPSIFVVLSTFSDYEDSPCEKGLEFVWEITRFESNWMALQLSFVDPECVSAASNVGDMISITFLNSDLFRDTKNNTVIASETITKRIGR